MCCCCCCEFLGCLHVSMTTVVRRQKHQATAMLSTLFGSDISREETVIIDGQFWAGMREISK